MSQVVTFQDFTPPARYDDVPWATIQILEAATADGDFTQIDTVTLSPVDDDPSQPAARDFSTILGTADSLWYELIWVDGNDAVSSASTPIQNIPFELYATADELFRILRVRTPSAAQKDAATRDLATATGEINSEIDLASTTTLAGWQLELCTTVCLDRAADLWRHTESQPGLSGVLDEAPVATPGYTRYSWERYAQRLAPIKDQFGFA